MTMDTKKAVWQVNSKRFLWAYVWNISERYCKYGKNTIKSIEGKLLKCIQFVFTEEV